MLVFFIASCSGGGSTGGVDNGEEVSVRDIQAGQCIAPVDGEVFVGRVLLESCDGPHRYEVAGDYQLSGAAYPGNVDLLRDSYRNCQPIFEEYVGIPFWDSEFDIRTITPSPASWEQGDREVTCLIVGVSGNPLEVRARDSGR